MKSMAVFGKLPEERLDRLARSRRRGSGFLDQQQSQPVATGDDLPFMHLRREANRWKVFVEPGFCFRYICAAGTMQVPQSPRIAASSDSHSTFDFLSRALGKPRNIPLELLKNLLASPNLFSFTSRYTRLKHQRDRLKSDSLRPVACGMAQKSPAIKLDFRHHLIKDQRDFSSSCYRLAEIH